jgi:hypothetical protein
MIRRRKEADRTSGLVVSDHLEWNVGSLHGDGQVKSLVPTVFPGTDAAYGVLEHFVSAGREVIGARTAEKKALSDLMKLAERQTLPGSLGGRRRVGLLTHC